MSKYLRKGRTKRKGKINSRKRTLLRSRKRRRKRTHIKHRKKRLHGKQRMNRLNNIKRGGGCPSYITQSDEDIKKIAKTINTINTRSGLDHSLIERYDRLSDPQLDYIHNQHNAEAIALSYGIGTIDPVVIESHQAMLSVMGCNSECMSREKLYLRIFLNNGIEAEIQERLKCNQD